MADQTSEPKVEPNVTRDGARIKVQRSFIVGATADFAKKEIRLTLSITLDESSLSVRDDLAFWKFDATPIKLILKPVQTQMRLSLEERITSVTLSSGDQSVTLGREDGDDDENS